MAHKCRILPDQKPICLVDGADLPAGSASASAASLVPLAAQADVSSRFGSEPTSGGPTSPSSSTAAVSAAAAAVAGGGLGGPAALLRLSVLNVDGAVDHITAPLTALARVLTGELEAAVTGKGFTR